MARKLSALQQEVISRMEPYKGYTQYELGITFKTVSCLSEKGIFKSNGSFIYLSPKGEAIKRVISGHFEK